MTGVFPYWGSCDWYREWLEGGCKGLFPQAQGHSLTRTLLDKEEMLTVPVEGGYRRLRRTLPEESLRRLRLSDHGNWRHTHAEALKALYGKAPYFSHYYPGIAAIYAEARGGDNFAAFTAALHGCLATLFSDAALEPFRRMRISNPTLFEALHRERKPLAPPQLSVLHAVFHLGPEAPFALL